MLSAKLSVVILAWLLIEVEYHIIVDESHVLYDDLSKLNNIAFSFQITTSLKFWFGAIAYKILDICILNFQNDLRNLLIIEVA